MKTYNKRVLPSIIIAMRFFAYVAVITIFPFILITSSAFDTTNHKLIRKIFDFRFI